MEINGMNGMEGAPDGNGMDLHGAWNAYRGSTAPMPILVSSAVFSADC